MTSITKSLKNLLRDSVTSPQQVYPSSKLYECKTRFGLLGTVGAGKSVIATLIAMTTQTLSSKEKDFFCRILERNSNIYGDISNMRDGWFPEKTTAHDRYSAEAGLLLAKKGIFGYKKLQMPICDVAGEDIQLMIPQYVKATEKTAAQFSASAKLIRYVRDCEGFILATDASRAIIERGGKQLKTEDDKDLHRDPDVNLVRILNEVFNYKDQVRKDIRGIAIVITKWDEVRDRLTPEGIDLLNPTQSDLDRFMDACFPSVRQAIKAHQLTHQKLNIRYFTSYVEIEREQDGTPKRRQDGSEIIKPKQSTLWQDMRKPSYNELGYAELIDWVLEFAD